METTTEFSLPYKIPKTDYTLKALTIKDIPAAVGVLSQAFAELEPIALWTKSTYEEQYKKTMGFSQESLYKGPHLSVIIVDSSNDIVAVSIGIPLDLVPKKVEGSPRECLIASQKNKYLEHYAKLKYEYKPLYLYRSGALEKVRGMGLIRYLSFGIAFLAIKNGFPWCVTFCTNVNSANACVKLGLTKVVETVYDEFIYKDNQKPFEGIDKFFTKILNEHRPPDKQLETSAKSLITFEGSFADVLKKFNQT